MNVIKKRVCFFRAPAPNFTFYHACREFGALNDAFLKSWTPCFMVFGMHLGSVATLFGARCKLKPPDNN